MSMTSASPDRCKVSKSWVLSVVLSLANLLVAGTDESAGHDQTGVVKSANQAIPGATVSATQGIMTVVTTTDQSGNYSLRLGPGVWTVEVTMVGFQPARKRVTISNAVGELDFNLQLKESATIPRRSGLAEALPGEQNRNEPETQLQTELEHSPTQTENTAETNEAFLISGTLTNGPSANGAPSSSPSPTSIGGQQSGGTPNLGVPGFGSSGRSNRRAASRGRVDSAAARQAGNRRQSSEVHGTLTFRIENSALNGKPFSITGQDIPQPAYAESRFTFAVGGPLGIPKIGKDPATFFFLNYNGTRYRNPYTAVETVPTELERRGDFSQSIQAGGPVRIYDPETGQVFPGNVIPATRLDPIALKM